MKSKTPEQKFTVDRPYKHSQAMLEAIKRIGNHPKPVSMSTNVPEFIDFKQKK